MNDFASDLSLSDQILLRNLARMGRPTFERLAAPAAGNELAITVPGGTIWIPIVVRYTFTASAAVANRFPRVFVDDGQNVIWSWSDPNAITAGTNPQIHLTSQVNAAQQNGVDRYYVLPRLQLAAESRIRTVTAAIDVGDAYSAVTMYAVEIRDRRVTADDVDELLATPPAWTSYL